MFREKRIQNQLALLLDTCMYKVHHNIVKGVKNNSQWIVWLPGRPGTLWEGGIYPIEVTIPQGYPKQPPAVNFTKDFKHVHIYEGGGICMPVVDMDYWKPNRTMLEIISRFDSFLHQKPNLYSPANEPILTMYQEQPEKYSQLIKSQAKMYSSKSPAYYEHSNVHIDYNSQTAD